MTITFQVRQFYDNKFECGLERLKSGRHFRVFVVRGKVRERKREPLALEMSDRASRIREE